MSILDSCSYTRYSEGAIGQNGVRYYSPPSVDDVMEIYDHSEQFVPESTQCGFEKLGIIFANEECLCFAS